MSFRQVENPTMEDFVLEAKAIIGRYGKKYWIYNPDCVDIVLRRIVIAHSKFDPSKGFQRSTYVIKAGIYGLLQFKKFMERQSKLTHYTFSDKSYEKLLDTKKIVKRDSKNHSQIYNLVCQILQQLNSDDRKIMKLRYLDGLTLKDIGKLYNVTREAIRQRINKIIVKLKQNVKIQALDDELNLCYS